MKSYHPTFPWAENTHDYNLTKLIETLGHTDTDVVIRLEDVEGLRDALQAFVGQPTRQSLQADIEDLQSEVKYLGDELAAEERQHREFEDEILDLTRKLDDANKKLEELEADF
jgi:chromosome segregation ATPase